jgi:hypothetical protein
MKKILFSIVFLLFGFIVFSQEFSVQWFDNMSVYLEKRIRDIPDEFIQSPTNRDRYILKLPNGIEEGFFVKNSIIVGIFWCKTISSRNTLYSEYDKYVELFKNRFGKDIFHDNESYLWNWNTKVLTMNTAEGAGVFIMQALPEYIGISQDEWDKIVQKLSEN